MTTTPATDADAFGELRPQHSLGERAHRLRALLTLSCLERGSFQLGSAEQQVIEAFLADMLERVVEGADRWIEKHRIPMRQNIELTRMIRSGGRT